MVKVHNEHKLLEINARQAAQLVGYKMLLHELAQTRHSLVNMYVNDRHTCEDWRNCNEDTCKSLRSQMNRLENMHGAR